MKKSIFIFFLITCVFMGRAQVKELEDFRREVTFFVNYDRGKIDSVPKTKIRSDSFSNRIDDAFRKFIMKKESQNLDDLKRNSLDNKTSYLLNNVTYFFSGIRRNLSDKSLDNNVDYHITFYGLYDYDLPNFVSFYIQPFTVGGKLYVVYYYSLRGKGKYLIKDADKNKIVYEGVAMTSEVPILKFCAIDKSNFFVVEDMGIQGQRALVLNSVNVPWKQLEAFSGKAFLPNSVDYSKKVTSPARMYLQVASNRIMNTQYGKRYEEISFDESTQTVSYIQYKPLSEMTKTIIKARWENQRFEIDDYYLGEGLDNQPLPFPD